MPKLSIKRLSVLRPVNRLTYSADVSGVCVGLLYGDAGDLTASVGLVERYGVGHLTDTIQNIAADLADRERLYGGRRCSVGHVDETRLAELEAGA